MTQPDMNQLIQQAQQMQAQLQAAQQEILNSSVEGEAGNGLVKVTMHGNGTISDVRIDPQVVDPEDIDTLQDRTHQGVQARRRKDGPPVQGLRQRRTRRTVLTRP